MRPVTLLVISLIVIGPAASASAWGGEEHIQFGDQISDPFEQLIQEPLPVIVPEGYAGPETFGHWVSAPDFARGVHGFIGFDPVIGPRACAVRWEHFISRHTLIHDEDLGSADEIMNSESLALEERVALVDCLNVWAVNNNHFGDFARRQFLYYHQQALRAAATYRRTGQAECRAAAYTLEAWGGHHLTDSTAAGHAWNPPGTYEDPGGLVAWSGYPVRKRIHNFLNANPVHFSGDLYQYGIMVGDHSEDHTADGRTLPERASEPQWDFTMRLSRMALGQVVAAAECGAYPSPAATMRSTDEATDPRAFYVSNGDMCRAMFGREIWRWLPERVNLLGLSDDTLKELIRDCRDNRGELSFNREGMELASAYFSDRTTWSEGAQVSLTIDPESSVDLGLLGCDVEAAPRPRTESVDLCGHRYCDVPADEENRCPSGFVTTAGCCYARGQERDEASGAGAITRFNLIDSYDTPLLSRGATPGGAAEFLWTPGVQDEPRRTDAETRSLKTAEAAVELSDLNAGAIERCFEEGTFSTFETFVKLPAGAGSRELSLQVDQMDEGLEVQVDGHLVRYAPRDEGTDRATGAFDGMHIPILTLDAPSDEDGFHRVRLVHLNDCGEARPLVVRFTFDEKADAVGAIHDSGACSVGRFNYRDPSGLAVLVLGLWALRRRGR